MAYKDPEKQRQYQREYRRKWVKANPEKNAEHKRRFKAKNPAYFREFGRRLQGLPEPTRPEPDCCECCGRFFEKTPHLDHDHKTNKFRGWICGPCNHALGLLGDSLEGAQKAVVYLSRVA